MIRVKNVIDKDLLELIAESTFSSKLIFNFDPSLLNHMINVIIRTPDIMNVIPSNIFSENPEKPPNIRVKSSANNKLRTIPKNKPRYTNLLYFFLSDFLRYNNNMTITKEASKPSLKAINVGTKILT